VFFGLNQDMENPRPTVRPKLGGVSLAAALPVHPLSVLSMLFSRKIANKTDKEFKMQIGMQPRLRVRMRLRMQFECVFWPQSRCGESTPDCASKV